MEEGWRVCEMGGDGEEGDEMRVGVGFSSSWREPEMEAEMVPGRDAGIGLGGTSSSSVACACTIGATGRVGKNSVDDEDKCGLPHQPSRAT